MRHRIDGRGRACGAALLALALGLQGAVPAAAQDARDLLGHLLANLLSPLEVTLAAQQERAAIVHVRYRGVRDPARHELTARVLDRDLRQLDGFQVAAVRLASGEGEAELDLRFEGAVPVRSAVIEVQLRRDDGRTVSAKSLVLPRPWPLGSMPVDADPAPDADPGGGEAPAPDELLLDPLPLGDTPAAA